MPQVQATNISIAEKVVEKKALFEVRKCEVALHSFEFSCSDVTTSFNDIANDDSYFFILKAQDRRNVQQRALALKYDDFKYKVSQRHLCLWLNLISLPP